jgi:nitrous oxide reductase accessory protein NosL
MIPPKWRLLIPVFVLLFITAPVQAADDGTRCVQCGMDLNKYPHSLYTIQWKDGTVTKTCGVQCGLTQQLMNPDDFKSSTATDLITNREFPAADGFYVFKSSVTTDMGPGFIAFKDRTNAEKFQKGFGGEVVTYPEALKIWAEIKKVGH